MKKTLILLFALLIAMPMAAQDWAIVKYEGGYTNVRRQPSTKSGIVYKHRDGTPILVSKGTRGWYKVYEETTPWNFLGYISASKVQYPAYSWMSIRRVVQEGGYTNIRKGRGTNYPIVGKVKDGTCVFVNDDGSSWIPIYAAGGSLRGYMSASKLEDILP